MKPERIRLSSNPTFAPSRNSSDVASVTTFPPSTSNTLRCGQRERERAGVTLRSCKRAGGTPAMQEGVGDTQVMQEVAGGSMR